MKVESCVYYNLNHKLVVAEKEKKQITASNVRKHDEYPIGYMPHQVYFGMGKPAWPTEILELRNLHNLPCLYCGKPMISTKIYNSIDYITNKEMHSTKEFIEKILKKKESLKPEEKIALNKLIELNEKIPNIPLTNALKGVGLDIEGKEDLIYKKYTPIEYTNKILQIVEENKDKLYSIEKQVLSEIKKFKNRNENSTLPEIFTALRAKHIKHLKREQISILNNIENMIKTFSENSKNDILNLTSIAKTTIVNDDLQNPFKRQEFIGQLIKLRPKLSKKENSKIMGLAVKLPFSESSVDAFIVKYSGANTSDIKIGKGLLYRSIATIEHIRPQKAFHSDVNIKYKNSISNCGIAHGYCNGKRRHTLLPVHIKQNPQILTESAPQKQINFIIEKINTNELQHCQTIPIIYKKTLFNESAGLIKLDISKLNIKPNINNN